MVVVVSSGGSAPSNSNQLPGTANLSVLQFQLANPGNDPVTLTSATLTASGTGNDATGIVSVDLYLDVNGNGIVDGGDVALGSGTYSTDNGTLVLNFTTVISAGQTGTFLVVDNYSPAAGNGTYLTSISTAASLTGSNSAGTAFFSGVPLNGAVVTIANATATPTSSPTDTPVSGEVVISPPYPNPSVDGSPVNVDIKVPGPAVVDWAVFTTAFRKINSGSRTLPGNGTFQWDLRDKTGAPAARGIYYLRLVVSGNFGKVSKIVKVIVL